MARPRSGDPDAAGPRRRRGVHTALIAVGAVALLTGAQLLALLVLQELRWESAAAARHQQWLTAAALVGGGAVLATGGTLRPRVVGMLLRARRPLTWTVVAAAALAFWGLAVWSAPEGGRDARLLLAAVAAQGVLVGGWATWARSHGDERSLPVLHGRTPANLLIALFLAPSIVTVLLELPDVYPFSRYPMYSDARLAEHSLDRVVFELRDEDGTVLDRRTPGQRQVLLDLVDEEDHDTFGDLAQELLTTDAVEVAVLHEVVGVAEHPAPPSVEVRDRREVLTVAR